MNQAAYQIEGHTVTSQAFYRVACDPARSVAVEACAGAGKTWMLVARMVRSLLEGTPAQDILAITFTKKAAGEMRARLQAELKRCASLPDAELVSVLLAWGFKEAEAKTRTTALRGLHAKVLSQGRVVQVRTFHSWFAALLRGAPLLVLQELNLPLSYELLEDDERAKSLVWPRLYRALAESPQEKQDFFDGVALHGRHQTLKSLDTALNKRVEFAMADAAGVLDGSVQAFDVVFPEMAGLVNPLDYVKQDRARSLLMEAAKILGGASAKTFSAKGVELETALTENRFEGVVAALLTQKNEDRQFGAKIAQIERVREAQAMVRRILQAEQQRLAALHHQRLCRLSRLLLRVYGDLKRERGWVDMNDLESASQRLLGDAELSGWMQQRMDARVSHLLIDEFQDTNPLQWQALYGWLSAYSGAGAGDAPSVFLVGDPKQSIYRFRRAEPQVFIAAQRFLVDGLGGVLLSCDHTRRCAPVVVQTLNTVMDNATQAGEYNIFRSHTTESEASGEIWVLPPIDREDRAASAESDEGAMEWRDSLNTPRVLPEEDGYSAREAEQAARWVAEHIAQGTPPGEIMVMSRKRERLGWMHKALQALGIPSEQPEKLELNHMSAVQDLVALLDTLVSPQHNLSLARALKSPLLAWPDTALVGLAQRVQAERKNLGRDHPEPSWWQTLHAWAESLDGAAPTLEEQLCLETSAQLLRYRGWVSSLPPHDALSAIFESGDVLARFAQAAQPAQRASVMAALRDVLAQSLALDGGRFLTAYKLVRSLKAEGTKVTPVQRSEAVRLLTVHGAKGLEARTVLLLDTDSGAPRTETMGVLIDWPGEAPAPLRFVFLESEKSPPVCAQSLLEAEQKARALEEINALYVALTRAEQRLVISSFEPHRRGERASWWQRLQPLGAPAWVPPGPETIGADAAADFEMHRLPVVVRSLEPRRGNAVDNASTDESGEEHGENEGGDLRTRMGLAMHRLLQWHNTTAHFEWYELHATAVAKEFGLKTDEAREACAMANRVVRGEAAWAWDANRLSHWDNEVELAWKGQSLRLDRLVQVAETQCWWVIDFKSDEHPEQRPDLVAQIRRYGEAVCSAQPRADVRLAFINALGQWREVTPV